MLGAKILWQGCTRNYLVFFLRGFGQLQTQDSLKVYFPLFTYVLHEDCQFLKISKQTNDCNPPRVVVNEVIDKLELGPTLMGLPKGNHQ
jgi:hypothetical protein